MSGLRPGDPDVTCQECGCNLTLGGHMLGCSHDNAVPRDEVDAMVDAGRKRERERLIGIVVDAAGHMRERESTDAVLKRLIVAFRDDGLRPSETQATPSPSCTSRCEWGSSVAVGEQCTATCARETEHAARAHFCGAHDPHPYLYASIVVPPAPRTWRGGRSVGRTLYKNDKLVGIVDTRELAEELTAAANFAEDVEAFHEGVRSAPMRCPCCESTVAPDGQPLGQQQRTATHPALLDLFFEVEQHIKKNSTLEMGGRKFKTPSIAKLADALAYARECTEQAP